MHATCALPIFGKIVAHSYNCCHVCFFILCRLSSSGEQRTAQRRLQRSLNRINYNSVLSNPLSQPSLSLSRGPITTADLEAEPSPTDAEPRAVPGYERIVDRVRDFLDNYLEDGPRADRNGEW